MGEELQKQYEFQYGSEARNYYDAVPALPDRKIQERPLPNRYKKVDVVVAVQLSLCGILIFGCSFLYVHMYSSLTTAQSELKSIKNQIRDTKSTISYTQSKISETLNLEYIRQRASKELGMGEPLPYQIVYVQLPKQSYTIHDK